MKRSRFHLCHIVESRDSRLRIRFSVRLSAAPLQNPFIRSRIRLSASKSVAPLIKTGVPGINQTPLK
jgi:hypothetical protein